MSEKPKSYKLFVDGKPTGSNPLPSQLDNYIRQVAKKYNVPIECVVAEPVWE